MNVLVTGHSRGLGAALAALHLARGDTVYGLARTRAATALPVYHEVTCDLAALGTIVPALDRLCPPSIGLDLVYLNAGILGGIAALSATSVDTLKRVMDVNLWANKVILDWLAARTPPPRQVILVSSGAGVKGNHGWGGYALSKAALNMLAQLYAHEMPATHLLALAPGLIDTAMQAELRLVDSARFPSVARLQRAHGTPDMPDATTVAARIVEALPALRAQASGGFVDLRRFSA